MAVSPDHRWVGLDVTPAKGDSRKSVERNWRTPGGSLPFGSGPSPAGQPTSAYRCCQPCLLRVVVSRPGQVPRDAVEQTVRRQADLIDRHLERGFMPARRLAEPAHLAHELPGGGPDLIIGGDNVGVTQSLDASAHRPQR